MCNMSKRNMDRIIQRLEEANYCHIVREKKADAAGRPARIIKANCNNKLNIES